MGIFNHNFRKNKTAATSTKTFYRHTQIPDTAHFHITLAGTVAVPANVILLPSATWQIVCIIAFVDAPCKVRREGEIPVTGETLLYGIGKVFEVEAGRRRWRKISIARGRRREMPISATKRRRRHHSRFTFQGIGRQWFHIAFRIDPCCQRRKAEPGYIERFGNGCRTV